MLVNLGFASENHPTCSGTGHPALDIGGLVISGGHNGKTAQITGRGVKPLGGGAVECGPTDESGCRWGYIDPA